MKQDNNLYWTVPGQTKHKKHKNPPMTQKRKTHDGGQKDNDDRKGSNTSKSRSFLTETYTPPNPVILHS